MSEGQLYLVGGLVRDVLLGETSNLQDIDLVVEGVASITVARQLQKQLGGKLECHQAFGTCTLDIGESVIDIVTARREHYDPPGTLPKVSFSTIKDDLARRDFSMNALAVRLYPAALELLDFHEGVKDLQTKHLRVLHQDSFNDDPTRIVRGARLAGRLGFRWEEKTRIQLDEALRSPSLANVSKDRLKQELGLTLAEKKVTPALGVLQDCGALAALFGLTLNVPMTTRLDALRQTLDVPAESYLLALLLMKSKADLTPWLETFNYSPRYLESVDRLLEIKNTQEVWGQQFAKLTAAETCAVRSLSSDLDQRIQALTLQFTQRRLSGKDVLDLGLKSGPDVGAVLARVAKARDSGQVETFEDELGLARRLVRVMTEKR
jgi:tRNA nucleotidyltransferase (CCA-adding enzyme)